MEDHFSHCGSRFDCRRDSRLVSGLGRERERAGSHVAKADRADLQQSCDQQGWPYYETACLRDDSRNAGRVLKVRVVSTDRIAAGQSEHEGRSRAALAGDARRNCRSRHRPGRSAGAK